MAEGIDQMNAQLWNYNAQPLWGRPLAAKAAVIVIGLGVGTGGTANVQYIKQRGESGYEIVRGSAHLAEVQARRTQVAVDLDFIRSSLQISVSAIGSLFNVTRQSVYLWMRGENPGTERAGRIAELADAISSYGDLLCSEVTRPGQRKLSSGATVVKALASGMSPKAVVTELVAKITSEKTRRNQFADRIRQRPRMNRGAADNDTSV